MFGRKSVLGGQYFSLRGSGLVRGRLLCRLALLACVLGQAISTGALGQTEELSALNARIAGLERAIQYAEAIPLAVQYAEGVKAHAGAESLAYAGALDRLARLYLYQNRWTDAEPLYKQALGIREKVLGSDHPDVASSMFSLAKVYSSEGRGSEAEPLYQRGLAIAERALGPDHPLVAQGLNNLGLLYWGQGRFAEAEPLQKRGLAIREKAHGPDHPAVGNSLNNLAEMYTALGRYAEAEPLSKRALAIRRKRWGRSIRRLAIRSATSRGFTARSSATPRPSRLTNRLSLFGKRRWVPTIPTWPIR